MYKHWTGSHVKRMLWLKIAVLLMLFLLVGLVSPEGAFAEKHSVITVEGADRYSTAVEASKLAYPYGLNPVGARSVVIATGLNWPDALGGTALAGVLDGPVLLVSPGSIPEEVEVEIGRLGADHAVILGGESAVSGDVEAGLEAMGLSVERIWGMNRYETANEVAGRVIELLGDNFDGRAFVATGENFPDALAAAPLAAAKGWPLFLAHPAHGLFDDTKAAMAGVDAVLILGGAAVVSQATEDYLKNTYGQVERLWGEDRYHTAVKVAEYGVEKAGLSWNRVGITTGENFPDALAGGVLQGKAGSVMLLTTSQQLHPATSEALKEIPAFEVTFFGGTGAVSDAVRDAVLVELPEPPVMQWTLQFTTFA